MVAAVPILGPVRLVELSSFYEQEINSVEGAQLHFQRLAVGGTDEHVSRPEVTFEETGFGDAAGVAEQLRAVYESGVDAVMLTFQHYEEDLQRFAHEVLPLLKRMGVVAQ